MTATVRILMNHERNRRNKLADAEVHFTGGELDGLKLLGFAVWNATAVQACASPCPLVS